VFSKNGGLYKRLKGICVMKILMLARNPKLYTHTRIVEVAEERGHEIKVVDTTRCYMNIASHKPMVYYQGEALQGYDAIIPRIGASVTFYGSSVVRQFEMMGVWTMKSLSASHARVTNCARCNSCRVVASACPSRLFPTIPSM